MEDNLKIPVKTHYKITILIFFSILVTHTVNADKSRSDDGCKSIDISYELGPIRNQGTSGWCYAFVAADLIGHRVGLAPQNQISAIDVAAQTNFIEPKKIEKELAKLRLNKNNITLSNQLEHAQAFVKRRNEANFGNSLSKRRGGKVSLAVSLYNFRSGACLESNVRSQGSEILTDSEDFIRHKIEVDFENYQMEVKEPSLIVCKNENSIFQTNFIQLQTLNKEIQEQASRRIDKLIMKVCGSRKKINFRLVAEDFNISLIEDIPIAFSKINKLLDHHQPVSISYNSCFLKQPFESVSANRCLEHHASLIVGRRKNPKNGTCEYKIRNSWGRSCKSYRTDLVANCEYGNVWVPQSELGMSLDSITWLK